MATPNDTVVGFTGHQSLSGATKALVRAALTAHLARILPGVGVSSLAAGSDQIFAECILELGLDLTVVIPSKRYEESFESPDDLATYRRLLHLAAQTIQLDHDNPSESAYWDAGKKVVDLADVLLAVWDGQPAAGLGGAADVVRYAQKQECDVMVVWPRGASRAS